MAVICLLDFLQLLERELNRALELHSLLWALNLEERVWVITFRLAVLAQIELLACEALVARTKDNFRGAATARDFMLEAWRNAAAQNALNFDNLGVLTL